MKTIALCSMLHEPADVNSATRRFRDEPVLAWTIRRLKRSEKVAQIIVVAWDDQISAVNALAAGVTIESAGPRRNIAALDAITAAQKWADGWRGGLLSTCAFDRGYLGPVFAKIAETHDAGAVVLIDAASGLVDPAIIDTLHDTAAAGDREYYFSQAPPGLGGVLLKAPMLKRLGESNNHPGRVVHYQPDAPVLDPVTSDACIPLPLNVSRSIERFTLDSQRQIDAVARATESLNGTLKSSGAEALAGRLAASSQPSAFPRELTIELTTRRQTKPIFAPGTHLSLDRDDMEMATLERILAQAAKHDDIRISFAGAGDPLLHPQIVEAIAMYAGIHTVSLETDLIALSDDVALVLVEGNIDIVSVNLPAMSPAVYEQTMGIDALAKVVENVKKLLTLRQSRGRGTPIIVPRFMKLAQNLEETETWYDTWLRALGSAVIAGPSDFAGAIPDFAVADMSPSLRRPCERIRSRLTILSDGTIVPCENDVLARHPLGHADRDDIAEVWTTRMNDLRAAHVEHTKNRGSLPVLCGGCREWNRP